jgi:hypothetical protein
MAARYLINEGGEPFSDRELNTIAAELVSLSPEEREKYRDENAAAIAQHQSRRILISHGALEALHFRHSEIGGARHRGSSKTVAALVSFETQI